MAEQILDISWKTILKILVTSFILYLFFLARDIIILFFFAFIISLLVEPAVNFLRWLKIPKILAVALVYAAILGAFGLVIYLTAPIFVYELTRLTQNIPDYFEKINPFLRDLGINVANNFEEFSSLLVDKLQDSSGSVVKAVTSFLGGVSSAIIIFALAFFISLEDKGVEKVLSLLIPKRYEGSVVSLFEKAQYKVAGWFMARVLACVFVGLASFVVFFLMGIKYSFILALLAGVMNFVPYVGPAITFVVSIVFVGVSSDWVLAFYVVIAIIAIQQAENNLLSPFLMKKFINLPPVLVLLSLLIGGTIFGFWGTIFSVPVAGIVYEFLKEFLQKRKEEGLSLQE